MTGDYEEFFVTHYDPIRRVLAVAIGDPDVAEEATQEAFARAYRSWKRVSMMERPTGWVYVVASNYARRWWRHRQRTAHDDANSGDMHHVDDTLMIHGLLRTLTARQRTAVVLRYLADLGYADIAHAMRCSESTARVTVHKALEKMRLQSKEPTS
jgi:RNA polymerase sigma-70 factor (ECF subfamily)